MYSYEIVRILNWSKANVIKDENNTMIMYIEVI